MKDKLPAQFRACKTIETHTGFCCFNGKISMHLGGDTNHEFTAIMFNCYGFRDWLIVNFHIFNYIRNYISNSFSKVFKH